jgi:D-serine deaminase-like pyridoxal phosphate-dependent protein
VLDHPELRAQSPSEEHLPLHVEGDTMVTRGDLVRLLPRHVCPTVNLADEVVVVDGGAVVGVERVVARGHEL